MCRLAYITSTAKIDCARLFAELEKAQGGDGNGVAWGGDAVKGSELTVEAAANVAASVDSPVLFHTRMASSGGVADSLCHPFETDYGWLAHNGIWTGWKAAMWSLAGMGVDIPKEVSDTWVMAQLVNLHGPSILAHADTGVWMLLAEDHTCTVYVLSGDLEIGWVNGSLIAASSIPPWLKSTAGDDEQAHVLRVKSGSELKLANNQLEVIRGGFQREKAKAPTTLLVGMQRWRGGKNATGKAGTWRVGANVSKAKTNNVIETAPESNISTGGQAYGGATCDICEVGPQACLFIDGLLLCPECQKELYYFDGEGDGEDRETEWDARDVPPQDEYECEGLYLMGADVGHEGDGWVPE